MILDMLKVALANHIEASLTVQSYHWNVEGPDFDQYHSFFATVYSDYYDQIDTLAEYIRIISESTEYVNGSIDVVKSNKTISGKLIVGNKPVDMCLSIIDINDSLCKELNELIDLADKQKLHGFANYCAERIDAMAKLNWKIVAITKNK